MHQGFHKVNARHGGCSIAVHAKDEVL